MATEDKFADEMLTEDELEQVAGGTPGELADDSRFLNVLLNGEEKRYHKCDRYGGFTMFWSDNARQDLKKSWNSLGIEIEFGLFGENTYKLNGNKISRDEAWAHAESLVDKHLTEAQWNW